MSMTPRDATLPGFFSWFGYPLPIDDRMRLIAEAGFSRTSIWLGKEEACIAEERPADLCAAAHRDGLCVECAHAPYEGCNLLWNDEESTAAPIVAGLRTWILFCGEHGIPVLVVHLSKGHDAPSPTARGLDRLADLVEAAAQSAVVIALENVRSNAALDLALTRIESPHLGFCYDSSHDFMHAPHPTDILRRWGGRLAYTHLSDNDGTRDCHWLPGRGTVDWTAVAAAMPARRPLPLSLEVVPADAARTPVEAFLAEAREKGAELAKLLSGSSATYRAAQARKLHGQGHYLARGHDVLADLHHERDNEDPK
jgi:sugar phosphate isomerase/epimerase